MNTTLKENSGKGWATLIPEIEFMLNATIQKSIGKSPAELVFGQPIYHEWHMRGDKRDKGEENGDLGKKKEQDLANKIDNKTRRTFEIIEEVLVKVEGGKKKKTIDI